MTTSADILELTNIFLDNDLDSLVPSSLRKDIYNVIRKIYDGGSIGLNYDSHKFVVPELKSDKQIFTLKDTDISGIILGENNDKLLILNTSGKISITPISISIIDIETQRVTIHPLHLESMSILKYDINQEYIFLYSNMHIHVISIALLFQSIADDSKQDPHLKTIFIKPGYLKIYPEFKVPIISRTVEDLTEFYTLSFSSDASDIKSSNMLNAVLSLPVSLTGLAVVNNLIMGCSTNKLYIINPASFGQTNVKVKYIIHTFDFLLIDTLIIKATDTSVDKDASPIKTNTSIKLYGVNDEYIMISMHRKILLYNLEDHRIERSFDGHKNDNPIQNINITGSIGKYIITIGSDKTIRVWDFSTYLGCVQILNIDDNIDALCIIDDTKIYLHGSVKNYVLNVNESSLTPREYTNEWDWIFTDPTIRIDFLVPDIKDIRNGEQSLIPDIEDIRNDEMKKTQDTVLSEVKNVIKTYYIGGTISKLFESHSKYSDEYLKSILRKSFGINVQPLYFTGKLVGYSDDKIITFKDNKFRFAKFSAVWNGNPFKYAIVSTRKIIEPIPDKFICGKNYFICKTSSITKGVNALIPTTDVSTASVIDVFSLKLLFENKDPYIKSIDLTDDINNIIRVRDNIFGFTTKTQVIIANIIQTNNEISIDTKRYDLIIDYLSSMVIANNRLLYTKDNQVHVYDLNTNLELKLNYIRENIVISRLGNNYICATKSLIEIRSSNFELIRVIPNLQDLVVSIIPIDNDQFISADVKGNYLVTNLNPKAMDFKASMVTTILNRDESANPFSIGNIKIFKISGPISTSLYRNISVQNITLDVKIILCGDEHGSNSGMCLKESGTYDIDDVMRIWSYSGISGDIYLENWRMLYEDDIYSMNSNAPIERTNRYATIHNKLPLGSVKFHSGDVRYLPNVETILIDSWAIVQYLRSLRGLKVNRKINLSETIPSFLDPLSPSFDQKLVVENVVKRINLYMYSDNFISDAMPYLSTTKKIDITEYSENTKIIKHVSIKDISDEEKESLLKTGTSLIEGKRVHKIRKQFLLCSKEMQIPLEKYYIYRLEKIKDKFDSYFKSSNGIIPHSQSRESLTGTKRIDIIYLNILVSVNLILIDMYLLCRMFKNIHMYKSKNIMIYVGDTHANHYRDFFDNFLKCERIDSSSDAFRCQNVSQFNVKFI